MAAKKSTPSSKSNSKPGNTRSSKKKPLDPPDPKLKNTMSKRSSSNTQLLIAIISGLVTVVVAIIGAPWMVSLFTPSTATPTLPHTPTSTYTITPSPTFTPSSTPTPTPYVCPYKGQSDHETIVKLIEAEATAINTENIDIILTIFAPNSIFLDYQTDTPKQWNGPIERYRDDLFVYVDFQGVEHFDIFPVGKGIDGDTAYYVSGSRGNYRVGDGKLTPFTNPSTPTTQYGSDHWVLQKNDHGCWVIIRMEFNAGHHEFPP